MSVNHLWRWRALSSEGESLCGVLWAPDRETAFVRLMRKELHPLSLTRCSLTHRWRPQHCYEMFRQLATLLQAGLTLSQSLQMLAEQHPVKHWQALLENMNDDLSEGCAFSEALKRWPAVFSPLYVSMVKTGELTGKLETCCRQLAQQQQSQQQLTAKVKKALRYPTIILALAVLVVLLLIPVTIAWALRQDPRWQRILMHIPVTGRLARGQKLGQIFTVLSLTQQAGIPFLQGLQSAEETVDSRYWQGILRSVRGDIEQGFTVWSSFQKAAVFTPLCIQLIRTGEVSGSLDIMLENLARHHTEQTFQLADNLAALLEPVLLIVTGVIIGTLVVAMYQPIFHLGDAMSAG
ncbi:TPA: type II secretion system F family protein [Enterobacter cloacae]|uniref:type II secretion system F family protein n=1 Tax=Enterobacter cloacae TaxID=550 RepID=UPI00388DE712|nr:type II secretion system F family protein [Enterobacter cloacae]